MSNENENEEEVRPLEMDGGGPLTKADVATADAIGKLGDGIPSALDDDVVVGQVIPERAADIDAEVAAGAQALGFDLDRLKPTWYASGTKMMDMGEAIAMDDVRTWEKLPALGQAMVDFGAIIEGEQRQDINIPLRELHVDRSGIVRRQNGRVYDGGLVLNDVAWRQLQAHALTEVPQALRANVNLWLSSSNKMAKFRLRNPGADGIAECHAVVGKDFPTDIDADKVAQMVIEKLPSEARAKVHYDGKRTSMNITLQKPHKIDEIAVGSAHRVGFSLKFADNGTSSFIGRYRFTRIQCVNCTLVTDSRFVFRIKHQSGADIAAVVAEVLENQGDALEVFAGRWRDAYATRYGDYDGTQYGAEEAFKRLIAGGMVNVPGMSRKKGWQDELLVQLTDAWNKEPGDTVAHVNQAITRMAHEQSGTWKSKWVTEDLEEQAGELLFARNYTLRNMDNEVREELSW